DVQERTHDGRQAERAFPQPCQNLVREGHYVLDDREDWSEHQPSTQDENKFIVEHGWGEYSLWHLGIDDEEDVDTKARYRFPYGDFKKVHRSGVIAAKVRAAQIRRHQ